MAEPTSEKHVDRLDRLERTLKGALVTIDQLVKALENENHSGARIANIKQARAKLDAAVKKFEPLKKD